MNHARIDSHESKSERAAENLLTAQFPSNYASEKTQREIEQISKICPQCGKEVEAGKKFCRHCGAGVESFSEAASRKVETPIFQQVISQQQIPPEPPKPSVEEKAAQKIKSQAIQRQETAQQTVTEHESPTEAAERYLKESNFKDAIAVLEPCVKNSPSNQEAYLLHLLASIKLYNIYGYEKQIESLKGLSNLTEKERGIAREVFLLRFEEGRKRGQEEEAREYQRLASRVILGQPLTEPSPPAKADETPVQKGEVKPFPERKAETIPQTASMAVRSAPEKIALPPIGTAATRKKRASGVSITLGVVLGIAGILGGGLLAYYGKKQGINITAVLGRTSPGKEQPSGKARDSGKTDFAQVLAAEELGFKVWGTGAADVNRRESLLSEKIESQLGNLRKFYQQQIQKKPDLMGSMTVQLTIAPSGQVTKVGEFSSVIKDREFKKSAIEEVYKWRFPEASAGSVKVNYPLLFLPPGMDVATLVKWEQSIGPRVIEPAVTREAGSANQERESSGQLPDRSATEIPKVAKVAPSLPSTPPSPVVEPIPTRRRPPEPTRPRIAGPYEVVYATSVYREPRENSDTVARIEAGTRINVVDVQGEWLEVRSRQGRPPGFVKRDAAVPMESR